VIRRSLLLSEVIGMPGWAAGLLSQVVHLGSQVSNRAG